MRLNELFEASEWRDRAIGQEAERVHSDLVRFIESNGVIPLYESESRMGTLLDITPIVGYECKLILGEFLGGSALTKFKHKDTPIVVMAGFLFLKDQDDLTDQRNVNQIIDVLRGQKEVFIHEFIHVMDSVRTTNFFGRPTYGDDASEEDYFNHPSELNAYYQEGINTYIDKIKNFNNMGRGHYFTIRYEQGFEETFENFLSTALDKTFWNNLTDDNKRRIRKRFYNFYTETMPEIIGEY